MDPSRRQCGLRLLTRARPNSVQLCRDVESYCHAHANTLHEYMEHVRRAAFNLDANPTLGLDVVNCSDDILAEGTIVERIQRERQLRRDRFDSMLQDKYDALNDEQFTAIIRCRRCGSDEVTWEEKQTRSADEGATVFCSCSTCKNRWVMRQ